MISTEQQSSTNEVHADRGRLNLHQLVPLLRSTTQYPRLLDALNRSRSSVKTQLFSDAAPFLLSALYEELGRPMVVVAPRPEEASRLEERISAWVSNPDRVIQYPETETLPFERLMTDIDTAQLRIKTLDALLEAETAPPLIVASAMSIAQQTLSRPAYESSSHTLSVGDVIDVEDLLDGWLRMGYQYEDAVYNPGAFSRRGGIIDIFPVGWDWPARIELWGNDVDSIRLFDPATQRSTEIVESIRVIPARETLPAMTDPENLDRSLSGVDVSTCSEAHQERIRGELSQLLDGHEVDDLNMYAGFFNHGAFTDYLPENTLVVRIRPGDVATAAWENGERIHELRIAKEGRGELPLNFPSFHMSWNDVDSALSRRQGGLDILYWGAEDLIHTDVHVMPFGSAPTFVGKLDGFVEDASDLVAEGDTVVAITSHSRRLDEIFSEAGVVDTQVTALSRVPEPGSLTLLQSSGPNFGDGFVLTLADRRVVVVGDTEIFGVTKQRRTVRRTRTSWDAFLSEISPGDYVVHVEHGIGRFTGVGRPSADSDLESEYMMLEYANGDKLYVPIDHLDRVTPYIAPSDAPPHLTRLGTQEWGRAKARAERSTRQMAAELIALYAARELVTGHSFGPDSTWQQELEESFPFEETPDQAATINEVKSDMESGKPMDRLVCGDVGYGKTEIALRAAFKAVMDGKQVGVLVPTTVLAQQHYVTFAQRLSAYPIRVEVLSRFRTDREQRKVVKALSEGRVDICIGTHRLIQRDVRFKDLGLVIVDEEQRFGVGHKERLKRMRQEVDVLTLTATPIPRTLHMSLAGVRDMSTIETPPEERLPIKTYVSEFSDDLIREAILRELDRQGQVYFLHNRVYNIGYIANYIRRIVPEASVGIAHGQMSEGDLEGAMASFADGEFDVLVCTTIIESGLDISNVNTLIVNRADAFGLAQLYQLRGRVGRSSRRAYAYLLIPQTRSLSETAERRLRAMLAATELGAGFRIAMKDLEIRGAGNILGAEQSGHIHAVGFELYTRLLSQAVEDLRARRESGELAGLSPDELAEAVREETNDTIADGLQPNQQVGLELGLPASLPANYVPDLRSRLSLYQRLIKIQDTDEIEGIADELRDRFGPLPWQVQSLLYSVRLKVVARDAGVDSISRDGGQIVLRMSHDVGGARRALQRRISAAAEVGNTQIRLDITGMDGGWEEPLMELAEQLADFRKEVVRSILSTAAG